LIPADPDADARETRLPHLEAGVAGTEVVLLLIAGAVGNVRLAIGAEVGAIGVENRNRVEEHRAGALEKADRQDDSQLTREPREVLYGAAFLHGARKGEMPVVLLDAEVGSLEELRQKNDLRAARGR